MKKARIGITKQELQKQFDGKIESIEYDNNRQTLWIIFEDPLFIEGYIVGEGAEIPITSVARLVEKAFKHPSEWSE